MADLNMLKLGRLAMRVEGNWWCAYYAQPDTMDKAVRLAKVHMSVVQDEGRRQAYMRIFKSFVGDMIEKRTGKRPDWQIEDATNERKPDG